MDKNILYSLLQDTLSTSKNWRFHSSTLARLSVIAAPFIAAGRKNPPNINLII